MVVIFGQRVRIEGSFTPYFAAVGAVVGAAVGAVVGAAVGDKLVHRCHRRF